MIPLAGSHSSLHPSILTPMFCVKKRINETASEQNFIALCSWHSLRLQTVAQVTKAGAEAWVQAALYVLYMYERVILFALAGYVPMGCSRFGRPLYGNSVLPFVIGTEFPDPDYGPESSTMEQNLLFFGMANLESKYCSLLYDTEASHIEDEVCF